MAGLGATVMVTSSSEIGDTVRLASQLTRLHLL
jgi:hypothetical protein